MPAKKKEVKILFVNPCLRKGGFTKLLPVGLGSVMTYFQTHGYKFTLLDTDINEFDDEYIQRFIKRTNYDFILIGTIVTHYKWIKWFVNMAKNYQPDAKIIVGNSVGSSIPELFLTKTKGDVVVIGEGEISAYEAVDALRLEKDLKTVNGIAFRNSEQKIIINEPRKVGNINDFPIINWDFFDVERYLKKPTVNVDRGQKREEMRALPVITARGCAFKCTFCHYVFWNDPYRNRKPKSILEEIKFLQKKYNVGYIEFWDDLSFASAHQVEKLCYEIIESGIKFKWNASVRVDLFSRANLTVEDSIRVAKKMRQAGCYEVGFSLESGNQEILEMMNKKIEADAVYNTIFILREADIICDTSVVFGYPIETAETINDTFQQCLKAGVYPSIGFLLPLPATGMYDYAKMKGFITDEDKYLESITERQDICVNMTKMSDDEIMNEIKKGAAKLNEMLELGLNENTYIKSKGYQNGTVKEELVKPLSEDMKRIENDVSFNYSATEFKFESQKRKKK